MAVACATMKRLLARARRRRVIGGLAREIGERRAGRRYPSAVSIAIDERPLRPGELDEPPFARFLFADTRAAWIWVAVRLYVGYEWPNAGLGKLGAPAWTGDKAGAAIVGFANGALKKATGDRPDVPDWYAGFLQNVVIPNAALFGWIITLGELLVGVGIILGALTGIAAFAGVLMNANYLLSGTVSLNPILIILGTLLVLAWRNAGWI